MNKLNYLSLLLLISSYTLFCNEINEKEKREQNIALASRFICDKLIKKKREDLTLKDIYKIHKIVLSDLNKKAGKLRDVPVEIKCYNLKFQHSSEMPYLMKDFIKWLNNAKGDPIKIAADAHLKLVHIHPFVDGNGRTARLLMNLLLMQAGYNPITISQEERKNYVNAVHEADVNKNYDFYYNYIFSKTSKRINKFKI